MVIHCPNCHDVFFSVTHDVGSVAALRRVKDAIAVAHAVMKYTSHTLLVGDQGTMRPEF